MALFAEAFRLQAVHQCDPFLCVVQTSTNSNIHTKHLESFNSAAGGAKIVATSAAAARAQIPGCKRGQPAK